MAYSVWLFAVTGDPVVQRLLQQMVNAAVERVAATVAESHDYVAAGGRLLVSPSHSGSITMQMNTGPEQVKAEVQRGLERGGPASLTDCDTVVELILVGDVDWAIVHAICHAAADQWSAILCDEVSGFAATLDDS